MSDTPRTDAVFKATVDLPWGSIVEVLEDHPPCDSWELSRTLELELANLLNVVEQAINSPKSKTAQTALLNALKYHRNIK